MPIPDKFTMAHAWTTKHSSGRSQLKEFGSAFMLKLNGNGQMVVCSLFANEKTRNHNPHHKSQKNHRFLTSQPKRGGDFGDFYRLRMQVQL